MPKPDERFEVTISLKITGGGDTPFFDSAVNYHDMKLDGVLAIESMMVGVLQKLSDLGFAEAGDGGKKIKAVLDSLK